MTNEEKARELGNINSRQYRHNYGGDEFVFSNEECEQSALEMAEWKDNRLSEELNLISDWFKHIAQMADNKKTLNGAIMEDSDAFDEIKCLAKRSAEYIDLRLLNK